MQSVRDLANRIDEFVEWVSTPATTGSIDATTGLFRCLGTLQTMLGPEIYAEVVALAFELAFDLTLSEEEISQQKLADMFVRGFVLGRFLGSEQQMTQTAEHESWAA